MSKVFAPPIAPNAARGELPEQGAGMHFRFEVNYIVDEITGGPPVVGILEIAWLEKRHHIRRFLLDYHRRFHALPVARHDLGTTQMHHFPVGVVDFTYVRERIRDRIAYRRGTINRWPRWLSKAVRGLASALGSTRSSARGGDCG